MSSKNRMAAQAFNAQLDDWSDRVLQNLDLVVRGMAMKIAEGVSVGNQYGPGTPVDTGFARSNWEIGINSDVEGELKPNPGTKGAVYSPNIEEMIVALQDFKAGDYMNMANNAVYGIILEAGHSNQAPAGMVRIVMAAAQIILQDTLLELNLP